MTEQNIKYDLSNPFKLFRARLRRSIFYLQYSHAAKASLDEINKFSDCSVFHTTLATFSEEELQSMTNDYKLWTRQNIISYLIEETIILFVVYKYWLDRIKDGNLDFNPQEVRDAQKKLILTPISMTKAIENLEAAGDFRLADLSREFLITLYDMRNSMTHHQGYAMKKEINLSYVINQSIILDANNEVFELSDYQSNLTLKESFPDLMPDYDNNVNIGIRRINQTMTINKDYFIGLSYKDTVDVISYFSVTIKKIWAQLSKKIIQYVKQ